MIFNYNIGPEEDIDELAPAEGENEDMRGE